MRRFQIILLLGIVLVAILTSFGERLFWGSYKAWFGWSKQTWVMMPYVEIAVTLLVGIVVVLALSYGPRREVLALRRAVTKMRDGDLGARVDVTALSMTQPVGDALNEMAAQTHALIEEQETLLQSVAHETRTPLMRMRFILEKMSRPTSEMQWKDHVAAIDSEVSELEDLISQVLDATKAKHHDVDSRMSIDVCEFLQPMMDGLADEFSGVEVMWSPSSNQAPPLWVERFGFERALRNVLRNALEAAQSKVRVHLESDGTHVTIAVDDDGPGIPPSERTRIFEPFVRLNPPGNRPSQGRGLGLSIVYRVVKTYGQTVVVGQSDLGGARMVTRWPVVQ